MPEEQIEIRCPGCGACYWIDKEQLGSEAECGVCKQDFVLAVDVPGAVDSEVFTLVRDHDVQSSGMTITEYMREHGVEGGVALGETGSAKDVLETDSGRKYTVGGMLAKGGMGLILNCRDLNIRRNVAMKVMLSPEQTDDRHTVRFIEEAQITGQLEHPGIVPVYELGVDTSENVFYTMKFVRGRTLKDILAGIRERDREMVAAFPLSRLLTIFQRVCEAMAYAHHKQVIHRDLKPENIMIGDFGEVYVMDWGLAKVLVSGQESGVSGVGCQSDASDLSDSPSGPGSPRPGSPGDSRFGTIRATDEPDRVTSARSDVPIEGVNTLDGAVMGTPHYMAPEQARGKIAELNARTDIYALGGILYEILSLEKTFVEKSLMVLLLKVSKGDLRPLPTDADSAIRPHCPNGRIPDSLAAVAMKALALDPGDRYASVQDLQAEIEAYQSGFATAAENASLTRQLALLVKRHKAEFSLAAAASLVLVFVLAASFVKINKEKDAAVAAREAEAEQRQAAETARAMEAERNRQLEYENYRNTVLAAAGKISANEYSEAEALLWSTPPYLRHWEWGYLLKQCQQELLVLEHPRGCLVNEAAFAGRTGRILTAANDGIRCWDADTGVVTWQKVRRENPHSAVIECLSCNSTGTIAVSGGWDGCLWLWDVATGRQIGKKRVHASGKRIEDVAFTSGGDGFASAGRDGTVRIWKTSDETPVCTLEFSDSYPTSVAFSEDGRRMVAASKRGVVRVWDTSGWQLVHEEKSRIRFAKSLAVSPCGTQVAVAGKCCVVWDIDTGKRLLDTEELVAGTGALPPLVAGVRFSPDGRALYIACNDRTVKVYDLSNGHLTATFRGAAGQLLSVDVETDGSRVIASGADGTVRIWDACPWYGRGALSALSYETVFTSKGGEVLSCEELPDDTQIVLTRRDVSSLKIERARPAPALALGRKLLAVSPDGECLALACRDGSVRFFDARDLSERGQAAMGPHHIRSLRFSPSGTLLVVSCARKDGADKGLSDGQVVVWDVERQEERCRIDAHRHGSEDACFEGGEQRIVTVGRDGFLRCWDVGAGQNLGEVAMGPSHIYAVCMLPDNRMAVAGTQSGVIAFVDLEKMAVLQEFQGHKDKVMAVYCWPDGARVMSISADQSLRIWDTTKKTELLRLGFERYCHGIDLSGDGTSIAAGGLFPSPRVWSALPWDSTPEDIARWRKEKYLAWVGDRHTRGFVLGSRLALAKDIGGVYVSGSVSAGAGEGEATVSGGGAIGGEKDSFYFVHTNIPGDFRIQARIEDLVRTSDSAEAGLMMRAADSPQAAFVMISVTAAGNIRVLCRKEDGLQSAGLGLLKERLTPAWLRLDRRGDEFSTWVSQDGTNWEKAATVSLALPQSVFSGLVVASHHRGKTTVATFTHARVQLGR